MTSRNFVQPIQIQEGGGYRLREWIASARETIGDAFQTDFCFWEGASSQILAPSASPVVATDELRATVDDVLGVNRPEVLVQGFLATVVLPVQLSVRERCVATATFLTRQPTEAEIAELAERLDWSVSDLQSWASRQETWSSAQLARMAELVQSRLCNEIKINQLSVEVEKVADNLASTYEEICLLHVVTQNLRISRTDDDLGKILLERLVECIPISGAAIRFTHDVDSTDASVETREGTGYHTVGHCPLTADDVDQLVQHLNLTKDRGPFVANSNVTARRDWPWPKVHELIVVPLTEGENLFGWLLAVNHLTGLELGSVEANLLSSLATMVGVHSGNRELYRQQREFIAAVVRALTSAIDAKDPYTRGHSDRVARMSVCLAKQLGCDQKFLDTIYMAGLLHDVGKIGIDDKVLRKPDRLTDDEYKQIMLHPEIGYNILQDLRQLRDCLPAVLHHHEEWNGEGYPAGLQGTEIPLIARIMAVADSYDAMHSDRPYRKGMPEAKVEQILAEGGGKQWDQDVIDAYFACRDEIRIISNTTGEALADGRAASLTLD